MTYVPSFKEEVEEYVKFHSECGLPYLEALQDLITGKREGKDLTLDQILEYDSPIGDLKKNIGSYKANKNEKVKKWAEELENLVDTTLTRAYGTLLIRARDELNYIKEIAPQKEKEQQELMKRIKEERERRFGKIPDIEKLLEKYGVK